MTTCEEIVCPEGCETALPEVSFDLCNPKAVFGQVKYVYFTNPGYPLTDENDPAEWNARRNLAQSNPAKITRLLVIGDKPASESTDVEMSGGRTVSGPEQQTLNFRIDEVNQENYDFSRAFQCSKTAKVWYEAFGGDAYGGREGIDMSVKIKHVIPEGVNDLQTLVGIGKWKGKDPCRFMHPLFGDDES